MKIYFDYHGAVYSIEAKEVAENRADHYEEDRSSKEWQEEVDYAMSDMSEIHDWMFNNMDPIDLDWTLEKKADPKLITSVQWGDIEINENYE